MMGCTSSQAVPPGGNAIVDATSTDPKNLVDNLNPEATKTAEVSSDDKYPPAEAFEISLDDVDNDNDDQRSDSLIKKHPPKRLQKLVEQAATAVPATTIEHLEEKLAKAEVRRQQYIQQRIENIITLTSKGGNGGEASDGAADNKGNEHGDGVQNENDGQKDAETAVLVSTNTITTTNNTNNTSSSSNSSQDGDVVVQPTTSPLNETSVSVDKKHIDGDHHAQGAADNGTHP